jgi:hypothetical protein
VNPYQNHIEFKPLDSTRDTSYLVHHSDPASSYEKSHKETVPHWANDQKMLPPSYEKSQKQAGYLSEHCDQKLQQVGILPHNLASDQKQQEAGYSPDSNCPIDQKLIGPVFVISEGYKEIKNRRVRESYAGHLALSFFAFICCVLFGFVAFIFAIKAQAQSESGRPLEARNMARISYILSIAGIVVSLAISTCLVAVGIFESVQ